MINGGHTSYSAAAVKYFMIRHILLALFFIPILATAQTGKLLPENQTFASSDAGLFREYSREISGGAAIFNGPQYTPADPSVAGHPFFQSKTYEYGSITYLGQVYDSLVMAYDVSRDQISLVYPTDSSFFAIIPVKQRISHFSIHGHEFVNIQDTDDSPGLNEPGYYDVLFDGDHKIICRRQKEPLPYRQGDYLYRFESKDQYYIRLDGRYRVIRSAKSIYQRFREDRKELKRYVRDNRLNFRTDTDRFLRMIGPKLDEL